MLLGLRDALASMATGGVVGGGLGPFLEHDYDDDGRPWGQLWMQPEPKATESSSAVGAGDSRPVGNGC